MIRALEAAGPLFNALSKHTDTVTTGNLTMDLRTPAGKTMWTVMAMMADAERSEIVKRLFSGLVFHYLQGKYIFGKPALPPGYILGEDRIVRIDEPMVDGVRNLLEAMANHDLTARQVVDLAGSFGVTTPTIRRFHGEESTFGDLRNADSRLSSLIDWIPTYESGHAEFCFPNPYLGATHFHSLIVEGATRKDPGFVRFNYDWPLPEGGWGDPDILAAAARRTMGQKKRRTGGAAHRHRKPLSGLAEWSDVDHEYRLSATGAHYIILRRETAPATLETEEGAK
jgi:hypothetical protein